MGEGGGRGCNPPLLHVIKQPRPTNIANERRDFADEPFSARDDVIILGKKKKHKLSYTNVTTISALSDETASNALYIMIMKLSI